MKTCPNCNLEVQDNVKFCPECGYGFNEDNKASSGINKMLVIVVGIVIAAILLFGGKLFYDKIMQERYVEAVSECVSIMAEDCEQAEYACEMIASVWSNSLYQEEDEDTDAFTINEEGYFYDDFNDALSNLFSDNDFSGVIDNISEDRDSVKDQVKDLKNPPAGCEKMCDAFLDYYEAYASLMDCAIDPSGSYIIYALTVVAVDEQVSDAYQGLEMYLE